MYLYKIRDFLLTTHIFALSAHMLDFVVPGDALAQVATDCALEDLHHECEQGACERGIPAALRGLVADEGVLSLHLQELQDVSE